MNTTNHGVRRKSLDEASKDLLFRNARSFNGWQDRQVDEALLREVYDLAKMGPTSFNGFPLRMVFIVGQKAKERLRPALVAGNRDKTMAAPVTVIFGYDLQFWKQLPALNPAKDFSGMFRESAELSAETAFRNGSLQGAYFIVAARALGLDCGPMSGFDNAAVDQEFFAGTSIRSNFICNLGYGEEKTLYPRSPRPDFDEVCQIL